jgi:hypothetical protein
VGVGGFEGGVGEEFGVPVGWWRRWWWVQTRTRFHDPC